MFSLMPWRKERKGTLTPALRAEHPLGLFRGEMEAWFDRLFGRMPMLFEEGWLNGLEIEETPEAVLVHMDAPGFEPADFDISVTGDTLTVAAERKVEGKEKEPTIERSLRRSVTLPAPVNAEKVEAKYRHGVLELRLPRTEPVKTRKVEVVSA